MTIGQRVGGQKSPRLPKETLRKAIIGVLSTANEPMRATAVIRKLEQRLDQLPRSTTYAVINTMAEEAVIRRETRHINGIDIPFYDLPEDLLTAHAPSKPDDEPQQAPEASPPLEAAPEAKAAPEPEAAPIEQPAPAPVVIAPPHEAAHAPYQIVANLSIGNFPATLVLSVDLPNRKERADFLDALLMFTRHAERITNEVLNVGALLAQAEAAEQLAEEQEQRAQHAQMRLQRVLSVLQEDTHEHTHLTNGVE